jgi:cyclophilin family peptidyl-prolyl cis-trans isomerase
MKKMLIAISLVTICLIAIIIMNVAPEAELTTEPATELTTEPATELATEPATELTTESATKSGDPVVLIKTSKGDIKVQLYAKKAPLTVKNFLKYAESKHYNGTIFHRVISNFMIQGGGFTKNMSQKSTNAAIKNEADNGLSNKSGTLAMARTPVVDSATNQFFINVKDNTFLDHKNKSSMGYGYCVFGKVIGGMDVVDKIKNSPTTSKGSYSDVPVDPIEIKEVSLVK